MYNIRLVFEFIEPVFTKTSPKRSFSVIQNERFGLVFVKTGSIISGIGKKKYGFIDGLASRHATNLATYLP
jgi:hypothetical protein